MSDGIMELTEEDLANSHREQLSTLYFLINNALENMGIALKVAEDYPEEISKEDAMLVRDFMKEAEVVMTGSFKLFIGFSEK